MLVYALKKRIIIILIIVIFLKEINVFNHQEFVLCLRISNKCCSFELCIQQRILNKNIYIYIYKPDSKKVGTLYKL